MMAGQKREPRSAAPATVNGITLDRDELAGSLAKITSMMTDVRLLLLFLSGGTSCVKGVPMGTIHGRDPEKCWSVVDMLCADVNTEVRALIQTMAAQLRSGREKQASGFVKKENITFLPTSGV